MAFKLFDRVKETSATTGTGALSLAGAVSQFIAFSSVYSNGDTFYYCIQDQSGTAWEVGLGTYTSSGNLLTRTTVKASSNSGSLVNFTSGALYAFTVMPAAEMGVPGLTVPQIQAVGRATAQAAANASVVTFTVGAADGSFDVVSNVLVTTSTLHNFTVTVAYTDEGNTSRVLTLQFSNLAGTFLTAIANAAGAVPYEGVAVSIRCKAATTITIASAAGGTYTTVAYNIEGFITQKA